MKVLNVDIERCTGCRTCEEVCSLKNTGRVQPSRSRIKIIKYEKRGEYHNYVPMVCQQCSKVFKNPEYGTLIGDFGKLQKGQKISILR